MKRTSIKKKVFLGIVGLSVGFMILMVLLHIFFYESYAIALRKSNLNKVYQEVVRAYNGNNTELSDILEEFQEKCKLHFDILMLSESSEDSSQVIAQGIQCESCSMALAEILSNALDTSENSSNKEMPFYYQCDNGIGFVGKLNDIETVPENGDAAFLVGYMPRAFIKRNTFINLSFLIVSGLIALAITAATGYYCASLLTKPLIEMSKLANNMARMKFDVKFQGAKSDEIGALGDALNRMSNTLASVLAQLRKSNAELAYEVQDNRRMSSERQRVFLNISHELKTPAAIINGCAEGLLLGVATTPEAQKDYLTAIADESARLNRLIHQLLDVSRIESNEVQVLLQSVALRPICERLTAKLFVLNQEKNSTIDISKTNVTVYTDLDMLEQVLLNYLTNAVRYAYENSKIVVAAQKMPNGAMRINVFNSGDCINESDMDKLWDQFYRTDEARTREAGGTGIGLSVVRAVAERLGDRCGVSNEDGGVVFWYEITEEKQKMIEIRD